MAERPDVAQPRPDTRRQGAESRILWLDVLRIGAILAVITIHTVSPLTAGATVPRFSAAWWAAATMNVASLWCVPVFVMISGGLLLRASDRAPRPAGPFYRRRMRRIGIPLLFWTGAYLALRPTLFQEHLSAARAVHEVAAGRPYLQMYYLFVIAGLYAVTPMLRQVISRCTERQLATLALSGLAFALGDHTLAVLFHAGSTNALTEWLPYAGYFVAGAWLLNAPVPAATERRAALAAVVSVLATVLLTAALMARYGWTGGARYFLGYQSPTVMVMSVAVLLGIRARGERRGWRPRRWVARLGEATFGVFLIHPLLLVPLLARVGRPTQLAGVLLEVPFIVLGVAAGAAVLTLALARLPVARRVVS